MYQRIVAFVALVALGATWAFITWRLFTSVTEACP